MLATTPHAMAIMVLKVSSMKRPPNILNVYAPVVGRQALMDPKNSYGLIVHPPDYQLVQSLAKIMIQ